MTHEEKILWPQSNITKKEYLHYLACVAKFMIPHIKNRPMTLIRCPHGVTGPSFFQKNTPSYAPPELKTYTDTSGKRSIRYLLINDEGSLLWAGNQNALEFHPWFAPYDQGDYPRQLAFDLDPSTQEFEPVREVAFIIRDTLLRLGLQSFAKTSGKTGIQVYVPIKPSYPFRKTREIMLFLATYMVNEHADLITTKRLIRDRGNKVYLDYVQHAEHKTLIAPYSARVTDTATVSTPVTWEELQRGCVPGDFTIKTVVDRVQSIGDLFLPVLHTQQSLDSIVAFLKQHRYG